jgi:hypothetical protein
LLTLKPAPVSAVWALDAESPTTDGTLTEGGAVATVIVTADPGVALVPPAGVWLITSPGVTVLDVTLDGATVNPAPVSSALAVA